MSDDKGEQQAETWPLPKFYFSVQFGDGVDVKFQEVSGLEAETQVIEFRHGNNPVFSPIKMPGLAKVGNVTMRKGIFAKDTQVWEWFAKTRMNSISPRTVVIKLLDEAGAPKVVWTLHKAWPIKLTGTDLKSGGNEVAVETVELAFERLEVKQG